MCAEPLIVLKLGGSVLASASSIPAAIHEIRRWRSEGWSVVAVVSALGGRTDELAQYCERSAPQPTPHTRAEILSQGELEAARHISRELTALGVPNANACPGALAFVATGDPLDAVPTRVDTAFLRLVLRRFGVVVIPGFIAHDEAGRTLTLGRGGSDLTALFLAHQLGGVRCRLVKDVDALYEWDPAHPGPSPRRFVQATYDDALETDGSIIQHKAVRFAREHKVEFELGAIGGRGRTLIGAQKTILSPRNSPTATAV